jgi:alkylation response protein AidB-like acyl-CoA dehydrogenase
VLEFKKWLDQNWDPDLTVREWWRRLAGDGYAHPTWPRGLGGLGASAAEAREISTEMATRGVLGPPTGHVGATLTAPTLLAHGTDEQKMRFVTAIADGREAWCQLFSEPGSGSDLASLATRAERDGEDWVVTGQKVWNSAADTADLGMLMARTDLDAPKHKGITFFLIDMRQPGIEVRPLRQMNGSTSFCEVFITEARVGSGRIVGELGDGWRIAQTTLAAERSAVAGNRSRGPARARSGSLGDLDRLVMDVIAEPSGGESLSKSSALPWSTTLELARSCDATSSPVLRQALARYYIQTRVNRWLFQRGASGSLAKIATSRICQQSRDLGYQIAGPKGMLSGRGSLLDGEFQAVALSSPGARLGGGTDEIQLNLIGERTLGLPREPSADKDITYRQLKVGTQRA